VLTVSQSSANDLRKFLTMAEYKVVPNAAEHMNSVGADKSVLQDLRLTPRHYVLAVGSLNPTKNFASLVDAYLASGLAPDIPLVIAGDFNRSVFTTAMTPEHNKAIVWAGPVNDARLKALYENAMVFAFPSLYEGFGIPPLEAMNCGCPVVASNASSIPEVCGDAALYFAPRDIPALAQLLREMRDNVPLRLQMIEKGRRRSVGFSWDRSAKLLQDFLSEGGIVQGVDGVVKDPTAVTDPDLA
jgi:glycosyltransferase involved in cell wall biosynthesis